MLTLWEGHDAGRVLKLTPGGVLSLVKRGELEPVARTPRGLRLYAPADVEAVRQKREAREIRLTSETPAEEHRSR